MAAVNQLIFSPIPLDKEPHEKMKKISMEGEVVKTYFPKRLRESD